jgi:hypothetical protein
VEENETISTSAGQYSIKVHKGNWEVEVTAPDKDFVLTESNRLIDLFSVNTEINHPYESQIEQVIPLLGTPKEAEQTRNAKPQTLNEFFRQFKLQTHLDKILVLGYWYEIKQELTHFTSDDILAKYKEIKEPAPSNIRRDLGSLVAKGLLLSSGKSTDGALAYELTNTGITEVETKLLR